MRFVTKEHILKAHGEFYDPNWMDSDTLVLPPKQEWDYSRELRIEDVNLWEIIAEPWDIGFYAAWDPYAQFYLIRIEPEHWKNSYSTKANPHKRSFQFETYYGPGSEAIAVNRMKELTPHANFTRYEHWIESDDMWLHQDPDPQDVKKFFVI